MPYGPTLSSVCNSSSSCSPSTRTCTHSRAHKHTQHMCTRAHVSLPVHILHFALVFLLGGHGPRGKGHLVLGPCFLSGLPPAHIPILGLPFAVVTLLGKFPQTLTVPSLPAFLFKLAPFITPKTLNFLTSVPCGATHSESYPLPPVTGTK